MFKKIDLMKHILFSILIFTALIMAACDKDDDARPEPEVHTVSLIAEENMEVGSISVSFEGDMLFVKYTAKMGMVINETYLHVWEPKGPQGAEYFHGFPFVGNTSEPDMERFAHKSKNDNSMTVKYEIPIENDPELGFFAIAAHAVVTSGMEVLENFADKLPANATLKVLTEWDQPEIRPSYFTEVTIKNTDGFLDGKYHGWCAQADVEISRNNWYDADLFSSLEDLDDVIGLNYPENINKVNWILNQEFVGEKLKGEGVDLGIATYGDVQYAIWDLVSTLPPVIESRHDMDRVNEIVRRATLHADFIPEYGGVFSIIFSIEEAQDVLIKYPVPYYEKESAWGQGEYFAEQENRAMFFEFELP